SLSPSSDVGRFNLRVDGSTAGTGGAVGDGGTTGALTKAPGSYAVSETGAPRSDDATKTTDLTLYTRSVSCSDPIKGVVAANATGSSVSAPVDSNDNVTCTISNSRNTGTLTVVKSLSP